MIPKKTVCPTFDAGLSGIFGIPGISGINDRRPEA
jgi:hypothetical protein